MASAPKSESLESAQPRRRRLLIIISGSIAGVVALLAIVAVAGFHWFRHLQNTNPQSGIAIGEKAPDFALPDATGRMHSLRDLMGPKGILLVFVRSADW